MTHLTADALIEAIDGPTVVGSLEGKSMPILTRLPNGKLGFRIMGKFGKSASPAGILRVTLENGQTIRVAGEQVFFRKGLEEVRAAELAPGDGLEPSWDYRDAYSPPDLSARRPADGTTASSASSRTARPKRLRRRSGRPGSSSRRAACCSRPDASGPRATHRRLPALPATRRTSRARGPREGAPIPGIGTTGLGRSPASATRGRACWVIGLAPAAHGGNRTGRIFTGDRSGDWLYAALYRAGFANQPTSDRATTASSSPTRTSRPSSAARRLTTSRRSKSATAACRTSHPSCALLGRVRVFVALGGFAFTNVLRVLRAAGDMPRRHARASATAPWSSSAAVRTMIGCYHPSQQNTFTGRLTERMLEVFEAAKKLLLPATGDRRPERHRVCS